MKKIKIQTKIIVVTKSGFEKKNQISHYVQNRGTEFVKSIKTSIIAKKWLAFSENRG